MLLRIDYINFLNHNNIQRIEKEKTKSWDDIRWKCEETCKKNKILGRSYYISHGFALNTFSPREKKP